MKFSGRTHAVNVLPSTADEGFSTSCHRSSSHYAIKLALVGFLSLVATQFLLSPNGERDRAELYVTVFLNSSLSSSRGDVRGAFDFSGLETLNEMLGGAVSDDCSMASFQEYYNHKWETVSAVPFSQACLDTLMNENPRDLTLRSAYVRKRYTEKLAENGGESRNIIYHCADGSGGLGDRLWGSAFVFYLSLALNARFGIFFEAPVHLDSYLEPAGDDLPSILSILESMGDDWLKDYSSSPESPSFSLQEAQVKLNGRRKDTASNNSSPVFQIHNITKETYTDSRFRSVDLDEHFFPGDVEFNFLQLRAPPLVMRNTTAAIYQNARIKSMLMEYRLDGLTPEQWMSIFLPLYARKATFFLRDLERPLLDKIDGRPVVGVQMRIGASDSGEIHWVDPVRYEYLDPVQCFMEEAEKQCAAMKNPTTKNASDAQVPGCVLLVTSDSSEALEQFHSRFNGTTIQVWEAAGQITHIDKQDGDLDDDSLADQRVLHSRAFSDWHLLAYVPDKLLISRSGFGELAALARSERPVSRLNQEAHRCIFNHYVHCQG